MGAEFVKESHASAGSGAFPLDIVTSIGGEDDQIDDNFYLVVLIIDSVSRQASDVSLAGESCTLRRRLQIEGNFPTIELWYVDHPGGGGETLTIGDAPFGDITFTWAVLEFTGMDDANFFGSIWQTAASNNIPTVTVDPAVEGSLVVGIFGIFGALINGTPQSGDTERVDHEATNKNTIINTQPQTLESGAITVGTTLSVSRSWLSIGIELLVTGTPLVSGAAILTGVGNLSPTGFASANEPSAILTGVGNLSPTGTAGQTNGTVILAGVGNLSTIARLDNIYQDESQAESGGSASIDPAPTGP